MSFRGEVRSIATQNGTIEIYVVIPMTNDKFKLPYICAIPDKIKDGAKLILEVNNFEFDGNKIIDYKKNNGKEKLIEQAVNKLIGNYGTFGEMEHAQNVSAPILIPIMPSVRGGVPYYQQLAKECFYETDKQSEFYRVDEQICEMIEDIRDMVFYKDIELDKKIFLKGYSSSGVFAQRFAFLHPELVDTTLIGGAAGTIPLPSDCRGSDELEYPLGTKDYEKITGKKFDVDSYKNIKFQYFLAEFEEIKKSDERKNELGLKAPMHDMSYMERSVPIIEGRKQRELYGKSLWRRFRKEIAEYENKGYNINLEIYKRKVHGNSDISDDDFKKIYNGGNFKKNSNSIIQFKIRKILDAIPLGIKLFRKKQIKMLPSGIDEYEKLINQIDVENLMILAKNEIESLKMYDKIDKIKQKYEKEMNGKKNIYDYPLKSKVDRENALELTKNFFESISPELSKKVNDIISGEFERDGAKQYICLQAYKNDANLKYYQTKYDVNNKNYNIRSDKACARIANGNDVMIHVPLNNDIRDVYSFVHEISHTFDTKNGENSTRRVMGEILPQCMERMLDEYLINLSDEDCERYKFRKDYLKQDVQNRKITTFLSRYNNIKDLYKKQGSKEKSIRYTLAQIYQTQFMKLNPNDRKSRIVPFIHAIESDNMDKANEVLGMKINTNETLSRRRYVIETIKEFKVLTNNSTSGNKKEKIIEVNKKNDKIEER